MKRIFNLGGDLKKDFFFRGVGIKQIFVSNFHTFFAVRFLEPFIITHRSQRWNSWLMPRFLKVVQDH